MTIQVTGVLVDPLNQPSAGTVIRVTALGNEGNTVVGLTGSVATGSDGSYNFALVEGTHKVEVHFSDEYIVSGEVTSNSTIPDPITLPDLIEYIVS